MEELLRKHRLQQKDLQSRITQKKKSATKKTRKGINDECAELERQLKERQASELAEQDGGPRSDEAAFESPLSELGDDYIPPKPIETLGSSMATLSISTPPVFTGHMRKPNRQKARQARRTAQQEAAIEEANREAADLPNLREKEMQAMRQAYQFRGLREHDIRSDGHCLYAAVADQLADAGLGLKPSIELEVENSERVCYMIIRQVAASYILLHPDDFEPFLEEPLQSYVAAIRDTGQWGGHLEILALAKAYAVDINVLQADGKVETIESGADSQHKALWLAYYRHSYGLGEHYNSLRRTG
ncbi:MAG: hypothetical protein Q9217_000753 [Psora testacea]